jgi:hypothetical protein
LFTFNIFTPNLHLINKINYIFATQQHDIGRPKIDDKLKQIPVGVRQSVIEKYGYDNIQEQLKKFIKQFN